MKDISVGISYAVEQKDDVEMFIDELKRLNISYFYDEEHPDIMWGNYGPEVLSKTYREFKCVVAFVSNEYLKKAYPHFEMLVSFHNELHSNNDIPYFLPIVYENVQMPSFYRGFFYIARNKYSIKELAEILYKKLNDSNDYSTSNLTLDHIIVGIVNELINSTTMYSYEVDGCDCIIRKKSNKNKPFLFFKYDLNYQMYYILDENNSIKAVVSNCSNNKLNIINYSLFASSGSTLTIEEFKRKIKRLLT